MEQQFVSKDLQLIFAGIPYQVQFKPSMSGLGETDRYATTIHIQAGLTPEKEYSVLLHEALHALLDEGQVLSRTILDTDEMEEMVVSRLEVALKMFIRENPMFITALLIMFGPPEYRNLQSKKGEIYGV